MVVKVLDVVRPFEMVPLYSLHGGCYVLLWVLDVFNANNTSKENVFFCVTHVWWDDTWAVDEVDALHQCDVLPDLGLSGDWSDGADLFLPECVDDGGFAGVWIANESDRDLAAIGM